MKHSRSVLVIGLVCITIGAGASLLRSPSTSNSSSTTPIGTLAAVFSDGGLCQAGESIPRGTTAVRLGLTVIVGPRVAVKILSHGHVVDSGVHAAGWLDSAEVTVPLKPLGRSVSPAELCVNISDVDGEVEFIGPATSPQLAAISDSGEKFSGRLSTEYLTPGHASWWSLLPSIIRHLGFGHSPSGIWSPILIALLASTFTALTSVLVIRGLK